MRDNARAGRTTTRARAAFIGMDHTAVHRAEAGQTPSPKFIASVLIAFYPRKFERYFEVVSK